MKKVIALIRTSTDKQEVESQKKEVIETILADGTYKEEEIVVVGGAGASAIKVDEAYMANINKVYELIDEGGIECVYAWAVDRIGRNEEILMQFKNRLIKNKVQLVIKNPSLRLLNPDGSVNNGVELAFSIVSTIAKQEMKDKKARFARSKRRNAEEGKFNGGTTPLYGYDLNDEGFYFPHAENADIVSKIFELMATGSFSITKLTKELRERGIRIYNDFPTHRFLQKMLKNTAYIGYKERNGVVRKYPRLISDQLFQKVQDIMAENNSKQPKATKHYNFAALLITCPICGRHFVKSHDKYFCSKHKESEAARREGDSCENSIAISRPHLDGLLWSVASEMHYNTLRDLDEKQKEELIVKLEVLMSKKAESERKLEVDIDERMEELEDRYFSGKMTKDRYNKLLSTIEREKDNITNEITRYNEEIRGVEGLLNVDKSEKWLGDNATLDDLRQSEDEKAMYDIVHKYISSVSLERCVIPDDVVGINGKMAIRVVISFYSGDDQTYYYLPKIRNTTLRMFKVVGTESEKVMYEPIIRTNDKEATTLSTHLRKTFETELKAYLDGMAKEDRNNALNLLLNDVLPSFSKEYELGAYDGEEDPLKGLKMAYQALQENRGYLLMMNKGFEVIDLRNIL